MLRSLSLTVVIAAALPVISLCPPAWVGGSSAALTSAVAQPVPDPTSTYSDPAGDTKFNAPAFEDILFAQVTKTASGDFELLLELAGPVPVAPALPPPAVTEMWWLWVFDLDPAATPQGYPAPHAQSAPEFLVYVSWDGTAFAGTAIDRRPLLTGGEAIIAPVQFSINGTIVEALLPSTLIGDVPPSFLWSPRTVRWAGPVGSGGYAVVDVNDFAIFNP